MSPSQHPYRSPQDRAAATGLPSRLRRVLVLLGVSAAGVAMGSYLSAELLYLHYPAEFRTLDDVVQNAMDAMVTSPVSMTLGLFPTLGFYGVHGILAIPGALMAMIGSLVYYRTQRRVPLVIALVGFVLWSHNNYLSYQALMSV